MTQLPNSWSLYIEIACKLTFPGYHESFSFDQNMGPKPTLGQQLARFPPRGEAKYLGPIKKSNARINSNVVQVAGASRVPWKVK